MLKLFIAHKRNSLKTLATREDPKNMKFSLEIPNWKVGLKYIEF